MTAVDIEQARGIAVALEQELAEARRLLAAVLNACPLWLRANLPMQAALEFLAGDTP